MKLFIFILTASCILGCSHKTTHWKYVAPNTSSRSVASHVCGSDWSSEVLHEEILQNNIKAVEIRCTLKE